jgi:hypothetical protein
MRVINKAITVTRESKDDKDDLTIYERFCSFSERLIILASKKDFNRMKDEVKLAYLSKYLADINHRNLD